MNIEDLLRGPIDDIVTEGNTITGVQHSRISQLAYSNGFSDKEFKEYLACRGVTVKTFAPPDEPTHTIKFF